MNSSKVKELIAQANTLISEAPVSSSGRRRYPTELKKIVRSLMLKYKLPAYQIQSLMDISYTSITKWSQKKRKN